MRAHGVQGAKRRGKPWRTTTRDPAATRSPDLVKRDFTAMGPDELWLADFTYLRCWEGVVFLSFVIDAYSRRVVGWQFAGHMRTDLVTDALRMALTRRDAGADVALIHHSDAGSQYTSYAFQQVLDDHAVLGSIGEDDGFGWPRRDGLKWPHLALVDVVLGMVAERGVGVVGAGRP